MTDHLFAPRQEIMEARAFLTDLLTPEVVEEMESYLIPDMKKAAAFACCEAVKRSGFKVYYRGSHRYPEKYNTKVRCRTDTKGESRCNYRSCHHCGEAISRSVIDDKMREVHWMCPYWVKLANTKFNKQGYDLQIYSEGRVAIVTKPK
jgi:hypothetical protein